jgi:chromatin structure-remodeling complex subunit RSC9
MQRMFDVSPRAEMTQVDFWNLYKGAFAVYGTDNMLPATDLIKLVTTVFPAAMAMVIPGANGKPPKFVIKGLERKRAAAEGRTKCHWDKWGCPEPAFGTPAELSAHVRSHLMLNPTTKCLWGSCTHSSPTTELFERHLLTHLPLPDLVHTRHPGQVDDVMVPPGIDTDADMGMPTTRPIPPVPPVPTTYSKPREDPPSTSLCALLIMRILYRTSFAQAEVVMKTDGDHFGFPGVEQNVGRNGEEIIEGDGGSGKEDGVVVQDYGYDEAEGQRKGKDAFKGIGSMLASVQIHDGAIMAWIDEMVDSIKALPISTI